MLLENKELLSGKLLYYMDKMALILDDHLYRFRKILYVEFAALGVELLSDS